MPEIAEVARVTHYLRQHLIGKTIKKVVAPDDANVFGKVGTSGPAFEKAVTGKRVVGAGSQGKYFWIQLDSPPHPVMHLGMTGWVHIRGEQTAYTRYAERAKGEKEQWPPKFWKFQLETDSEPKVEVAFTDSRRFGRIRLVDCPGEEIRKHSPLKENGPDPVVDRDVFTEEYLKQKMRKRHVPIKALLLDQAMISGIGNWVGDEIMYQAKLHPEQYSDDFSDADITKLYKAASYVCETAVGVLGDSDRFPSDWLFNHRWGKGKKDHPTTLPNGDKIIFITVGGRTSCVVPSRQKKTGKATIPDAKEEIEAKEEETESKFFEGKETSKPKNKAAPSAKQNGANKRKAIQDDEDDQDDVPVTNAKKSKRGKQVKQEEEAPEVETEKVKQTKSRRPLTTTFTPPPDCTGGAVGVLRANSGSSYFLTAGPGASSCFPSGKIPGYTEYYSPGLCPHGFTAACLTSSPLPQGNGIETVATCCPTAILDPNVVSSLSRLSAKSSDVSGRVTLTSPIINAIAVQVRYQSTDSAILGFATPTSSNTALTTTSIPPQKTSTSGLSGGAIAGIVVGVAVALILVIGSSIYLLLSKRRKAKDTRGSQGQNFNEIEHNDSSYNSSDISHQPFTKAELPDTTSTIPVFDKPELTGSGLLNGALPPALRNAPALERDVELPGLRDLAELENASRPSELPG
ncbi:formamidopyrimidine-DNA glycosylase domain-containing protein [Seiridium cupressi]